MIAREAGQIIIQQDQHNKSRGLIGLALTSLVGSSRHNQSKSSVSGLALRLKAGGRHSRQQQQQQDTVSVHQHNNKIIQQQPCDSNAAERETQAAQGRLFLFSKSKAHEPPESDIVTSFLVQPQGPPTGFRLARSWQVEQAEEREQEVATDQERRRRASRAFSWTEEVAEMGTGEEEEEVGESIQTESSSPKEVGMDRVNSHGTSDEGQAKGWRDRQISGNLSQ